MPVLAGRSPVSANAGEDAGPNVAGSRVFVDREGAVLGLGSIVQGGG